MNVIGTAIEELYRIYAILNHDKFDNDLPEPVITIQKTRGNVLGHCTTYKAWKNKQNTEDVISETEDETAYYEINIYPRWFDKRTAEEVVETLLHEMCHYCNKLADIKDCNGNVHNKKFKSMAESVGLIVEKDKKFGYGITFLSNELMDYIKDKIKPNEEAFEYFRSDLVKSKTEKKTKRTFEYTCLDCGQSVKGKRDIAIMCGTCKAFMKMEDVEEDDSENNND